MSHPGAGTNALDMLTILEVLTPDGEDIAPPHEEVPAGRALALYASPGFTLTEADMASLSDSGALAQTLTALVRISAMIAGEELTAGESQHYMDALSLCSEMVIACLRVAAKTDAELAQRFRVQIQGGAG